MQQLIRANNTWTYNLDSLKRANFTIGHININSLANKYEHIREVLNAAELDVLLLNETKLDESIPSTAFMVPDYYLLRRDRNSRGGGIAIYVNKSYRIVSTHIDRDFELVHLKLGFGKERCYHILATYKPPYERSLTYVRSLQSYMSKLNLLDEDYFIVGDLNMNWLDDKGKMLKLFCRKNKLRNFIKQPTRVVDTVNSHFETLIDVVLHNREAVVDTSVHEFPFSDHSFVLVECDLDKSAWHQVEQQRLSRRQLDKTIAGITEIINQIDFSILNDDKLVISKLKKFNMLCYDIINKKTLGRKIKHEELVHKHKSCVSLFKMYSESKSPRTVKNIVQKMMQNVSYLTYKLCHMWKLYKKWQTLLHS